MSMSRPLALIQTMLPDHLLVLAIILYVFVGLLRLIYSGVKRTRRLKFLRGPPSPGFLLGHELALSHQTQVCELETKWSREYGSALRLAGCCGEGVLLVADPQALQHILHSSGRYPKPKYFQQGNKRLFGRGILWAEGDDHQRHRKALNPAFSPSHLKQFLSLIERSTRQLIEKWDEELDGDSCKIIDVTKWFPRVTLDIIGESAFNFKFGALDNETNELSTALKNIFIDSRARTQTDILFHSWRLALPSFVARCLGLQTPEDRRFATYLNTSKRYAKAVLDGASYRDSEESEGKDVLSVLARSNSQEDPKKRLDDDEVLSQISTMILAGHETTASTLTWLLYEFARHPEDQRRVREEIASVRIRNSNGQLTSNDYDSMRHFNSVIKECLRLYPIAPVLIREANEDDVIPLLHPVLSPSGESIAQISVQKGQKIHIPIPVYNRLPSVFGDDANKWNPSRFDSCKKDFGLGYLSKSNLLTFSSGVRGCIGWQFAIMELQSIVGGLIEAYEISLPPEGLDVLQVPAGTISPMIRGQLEEGIQMPLRIRKLDNA